MVPLLSLQQVCFHTAVTRRALLQSVSLELMAGESLVLIGPGGSGKTLLLRLMAGLLSPSQGTIACQGKLLGAPRTKASAKASTAMLSPPDWRRSIAYVPAQPRLLGMTAREAIALPLQHQGLEASQIQARLGKVAELCRLPGALWDKAERELSLAEIRWVAIARALMTEPLVLLVDEADGPEPLPWELLAALQTQVGCPSLVAAASQVPEPQSWLQRYGSLRQGSWAEGKPGELLGEPVAKLREEGKALKPLNLALEDWD
jgi:ABC-type iron transport system FetAB ATPase subunit